MSPSIPASLSPFFQEYDFETLDVTTAAPIIIERTLQFGNRLELRWLFMQYGRAKITDWFRQYAQERLPDPHRSFWALILEIAA
ncbi:MAG: hypothetical protein Fur0035_02360 [Anaerolineales bacterium]